MKKKYILLTIASLLLILVGIYAYQSVTYTSHFLPKTTINGVNVGKLTAATAHEKIAKKTADQTLTVSIKKEIISEESATKAGIEPPSQAQVKQELSKQRPLLWLFSAEKEGTIPPIINKQTHDAYLATIREKLTEFNSNAPQTKNAEIAFKDEAFTITDEQYGETIDIDKEIKAIDATIQKNQFNVTIDPADSKPTIFKDDAELQTKLTTITKILEQTYTYIINGEDVNIPKEALIKMIDPSQGTLINSEAVTAYLSELGKTKNTSTNSTSFASTRRGTVTVPAGTFSWTIDEKSEAEALIQDLTNAQSFKRPPAFVGSTTPETALIGKTYIEVDLTNQHMWFYQDGKVILETDVVTGKPSTATPPGVNYVWKKERNATLTGENYASPVDYWMPIDWDGVGIHDSNWQTAYGGDRFVQYGSHGCINTPPEIMKQLFEKVEIGTPVIVF